MQKAVYPQGHHSSDESLVLLLDEELELELEECGASWRSLRFCTARLCAAVFSSFLTFLVAAASSGRA
eukprot:566132-Karenia_brevis.AAC.1